MKLKIRGKLILSYICIILVMGIISLGFISVFAESYILNDAQNKLRQEAEDFAKTIGRAVTSLDYFRFVDYAVLKQQFDYSLLIVDTEGAFVDGHNLDNFQDMEALVKSFANKSNQLGSQIVNFEGNSYAAYIQPIKSMKTDTVLGYAIPFFAVKNYSFDHSLSLLYFFALSLAGLFAVLLGTFMADTLTRNIKRLKTRANLVANREFDVPVPIDSTDEIGELAQSINSMAQSIKEYDLGQKIFLQNASHEFRTPLMSIRGYVEGENDGVFDMKKGNEEILNQVARLEKLVEEVLYLSKIENTEGVYSKELITLENLIEEAVERTKGIVTHEKIDLVVDPVPEYQLEGDGDKLATVLTNIISNCLRFARNEIHIAFREEGGQICIVVSDDGPGFAVEDLPHIFDRFYKGKKGNHGLGLAIAKAIVTYHGGAISAYNKQAVTDPVSGRERCGGAVFEVKLPVKN